MPAKNNLLKQLSMVLLCRDASPAVSTTTNAANAKGQKVVKTAATTGFAAGDTVRVGSGDELELGVVASIQAGTSLTMVDNLTYDHVSGEDVVKQIAYDVGDITDGGVGVSGAAQSTDVEAATKRLALTTLNGYTDLSAEFSLPGLTLDNLAIACGVPFANISGNGSASTPYSYASDGNDFGAEQNQSLIVIGLAMDGSPRRVELWSVDFDYTGISVALKRGQLAAIPCKAMAAAGGVITTNASAYVPNVSRRPSKGKVFDSLQEAGAFADATTGPLATTTTAAVAAGASVLPCTSVTNLVAGDWIKVSTGDLVEFHQVDAINVLNVTIKSKVLRAHASGVAVVRQALASFGGIHEDGPTFAIGGSVEPIHLANKKLSVGLKLGAAVVTITVPLAELTLANFARALGIPQSAIAGGRLPIGQNVGTSSIEGVYLRGALQDGTTAWLNAWACAQDVSAFALTMARTGVAQLPARVKPSSGFHWQQS